MGSQAIYTIIERGERTHFYSQWGANSLTPMVRLQEAMDIQNENKESLSHIFSRLSGDGTYLGESEKENSIFQKLDLIEEDLHQLKQEKNSDFEMFITLDMDSEEYTQGYNRHFAPYQHMEIASFISSFQVGLANMQKIMDNLEELGLDTFDDAVNFLDEKTGVGEYIKNSIALYTELQKAPDLLKQIFGEEIPEETEQEV